MAEKMALGSIPADGGVDKNVAANQRFLNDDSSKKVNLAIGTNAGADGKPWDEATAYHKALAEMITIVGVDCGGYVPIGKFIGPAREFILTMLGLKELADRCLITFSSDGGTGALDAALKFVLAQNRNALDTFCIQEDSWPGYFSLVFALGKTIHEIPINDEGREIPTIWQTIHNGTGMMSSQTVWEARAENAAKTDTVQILDLPYLGFEGTREGFREIIENSHLPVQTMAKADAPLIVCWAPTKIYNTFAFRPGGIVVVVCRSVEEKLNAEVVMTKVMRGRGCGFTNVATAALAKAMADNPDELVADHSAIIQRLSEATADWRQYAGEKLAPFFAQGEFGGLFRILPTIEGAVETLAKQHIHVVNASKANQSRIRINAIGLPHNRAAKVVSSVEAVMAV